MRYRDIIKAIFRAENEDFIPDGLAYSEAVCERRNGVLLDSFLWSWGSRKYPISRSPRRIARR